MPRQDPKAHTKSWINKAFYYHRLTFTRTSLSAFTFGGFHLVSFQMLGLKLVELTYSISPVQVRIHREYTPPVHPACATHLSAYSRATNKPPPQVPAVGKSQFHLYITHACSRTETTIATLDLLIINPQSSHYLTTQCRYGRVRVVCSPV
ncbi:hypothetical protein L873DRAFT_448530 [Choiromyces venosus 120613-1]|uniref:Uncharacterized protein n=1 Tax=Choiromyces venosus 120613-1 TaxID=1336337 RepID=A0A3N4K8L2_9PEZI|nr:hypothetical protein L873DRAFT_448530 [Choiromyces venosus 120613-1]